MLATYKYLENINKVDFYTSFSEPEMLEELQKVSSAIKVLLSGDIKSITGENNSVRDIAIAYNDPDYRQCATGIILEVTFEEDKEFQLYIEVLVDFGKVLISFTNYTQVPSLKLLSKRIQECYTSEQKAELKNI